MSYAMNEMCLATIFIIRIGLNVIWPTCDVFYVYKWSSCYLDFFSANTIYAYLIVKYE